MKTVSSICATGSITALSVVGLTIASDHNSFSRRDQDQEMTAVANYPTVYNSLDSPFPLPATRQRRFVSEGDDGSRHASNSSSSERRGVAQKRYSSSVLPTTASNMAMEITPPKETLKHTPGSSSTQPNTWLRRLSSSVSTSRDSSRAPSRPGSAAYSAANGSVAVSHPGSTTPMFAEHTPAPLTRNKLVKRTISTPNATDISSPASASRLPVPNFKRPATSRQRSATLQAALSKLESNRRRSLDGHDPEIRGSPWHQYFTPRISSERPSSSKRRSSTSIPNPIRRVYPDRKYTPTLVSSREIVRPMAVELDDDLSEDEHAQTTGESQLVATAASSPFPPASPHFEESAMPRRSFSIGDLLSTGPQPLWRRPSSRSNAPGSRGPRKLKSRRSPQAHAAMGNAISHANGHPVERPAKRRDVSGSQESRRSIYSSSSSSYVPPHPDAQREIELNLGSDSPFLQFASEHSFTIDKGPQARTPSPIDQNRLPSGAFSSSSRPARLSTSEVTSTVGSDSEYRSLGDNSTDYQSDNAYDSIQTRTTRSSSGRRGPHIETIFDESPPISSAGRSTNLRDILNHSQLSGSDHNIRYRHSVIEEEGSVISTPVRSLRNKSVTSTPSARHGAVPLISSSPPQMMMPDPDDIDWDGADNDSNDQGLGIQRVPSTSSNGTPVQLSLPFRFGPTLRPSNSRSANSTPLRAGASPLDKANVFDWAEHQPSPIHLSNTPPRPRTVHGKKDQDSRGGRPAGRRPASGMHARSHSVPVVPDLDGKRSTIAANKFGTWGVGSKAVTEDWNEDFDFDELPLPANGHAEIDNKRIDSGHAMLVPRSIREQQANVVANIGLLREWGLLIEELKELRMRAVALEMLDGPFSQAWREVDAMIELADQETEEQTLEPRQSPPSSPGFDYSMFEDTPNKSEGGRLPPLLPTTNNNFTNLTTESTRMTTPQSPHMVTRPRKDSELVAQTVIAALQSKRLDDDTKKVPFDTATLRHIVPYVNRLKRIVKDALRETEGLYSSPHRRSPLGSQPYRE